MDRAQYQVVRRGCLLNVETGSVSPRDVLVKNRMIIEIGAPGLPAPEEARLIDAQDKLLMPGLVNAHTHGHGSLSKGMGDLWTLELLLNAGPWISGKRTLEDKYLTALLNGTEMLFKGCTAAYDLYFEFPVPTAEGLDAVARGYADAGVRAVIAPMMADRSLYQAIPGLLDYLPAGLRQKAESVRLAPYEESVKAAETALRAWTRDRDFVRPAIAPTVPLHCSDEFLIACRDLAREHQVSLHMHLAESKAQAVSALRRYDTTLAGHLDRIGLLGPNFVGAHSVWLDQDDIARLADNGCSAAHNPGANLRLGSGIAAVRDMLARGVNVGIGTDGSNSSDSQNMFEAMRLAAYVSRITTPDYQDWLTTGEALKLATLNSARALGLESRIGQLTAGYEADIVFLDLGSINFVPLNDPVRQIVNSEDSSSVHSVMVGGEIVLDGRRPTKVNYEQLRADVARSVERLNQTTEDSKRLALELEDLVGSYCSGLAKCSYHVRRTLHGEVGTR